MYRLDLRAYTHQRSRFQHKDIIDILYKLATEAGATVEFHKEVASVEPGTEEDNKPSVTLVTGEVLTADVIVGADGCKSLVREVVLEEEDCAEPGGMTLYSGVIDAEDMDKDPDLKPFILSDEVSLSKSGMLGL